MILLLLGSASFAAVKESDFLEISSHIKNIYKEKAKEKSATILFTLKKGQDLPNAYAAKRNKITWEITVIESLLKLEKQSPSSLAMILCHEMGHFLGGGPFVIGRQLTPAVRSRAPKEMSCEGQADFFAGAECFKELTLRIPNILNNQEYFLPAAGVSQNCEKTTSHINEIEICKKRIHASYQTILVYQELLLKLKMPERFSARVDNEPSENTLNQVGEYPTLDCRFETLVKGTLCSGTSGGECIDTEWQRPDCWL